MACVGFRLGSQWRALAPAGPGFKLPARRHQRPDGAQACGAALPLGCPSLSGNGAQFGPCVGGGEAESVGHPCGVLRTSEFLKTHLVLKKPVGCETVLAGPPSPRAVGGGSRLGGSYRLLGWTWTAPKKKQRHQLQLGWIFLANILRRKLKESGEEAA